jgi:oxygen-independent coproporphyrinogen-3 oxidase
VGLGPSAASHAHGVRWKNRPHIGDWERAIDAGELPAVEVETLSTDRRMGEYAMLRLRLSDGIVFSDFAGRWNCDARELFADPIDRYNRAGLLAIDENSVRLTESGVAVADAIAAEFLAAASNARTNQHLSPVPHRSVTTVSP